jgi:hypothetical protein
VQIIKLYIEENMSMIAVAEKLKRSSGTPLKHIHRHNNAVARSGVCLICERVGSQYYDRIVEKGIG